MAGSSPCGIEGVPVAQVQYFCYILAPLFRTGL